MVYTIRGKGGKSHLFEGKEFSHPQKRVKKREGSSGVDAPGEKRRGGDENNPGKLPKGKALKPEEREKEKLL